MSLSSFLTVLSAVVFLVHGDGQIWQDCGTDYPHRAVNVRKVEITPMPIRIPGTFKVTVEAEVLTTLDDIFIKASIKRSIGPSWFRIPLEIPCDEESGLGSCDFDACGLAVDAGWEDSGCPKALSDNKLPCLCPIQPIKNATMISQEFSVGPLKGGWSAFINGDYTVEGIMRSGQNSTENIGCYSLNLGLAAPKTPADPTGNNEDPVGY